MSQEADSTWDPSMICHRCGALLQRGNGSFWVVRIESIADPSPPTDDDEGESSTAAEHADIADLLEQMSALSEQELLDQVHRRVALLLCARCHSGWIENPAG